MSMSPQQLRVWSRRRSAGEKAFRLRTGLTGAVVFGTLQMLFTSRTFHDARWISLLVITILFGVALYLVAGTIWQRNETEFVKHSGRDA
jgi:hypothetical protein